MLLVPALRLFLLGLFLLILILRLEVLLEIELGIWSRSEIHRVRHDEDFVRSRALVFDSTALVSFVSMMIWIWTLSP